MKINIQKNKVKKTGFTLFEMLVVLAIVSFVASVTFSSFPKMNSKLSLDLLTQDIALTIRQAQIYGTTVFGVGEIKTGGTANYQAYGVSFPTANIVTLDSGKYAYTLFADVPVPNEQDTSNLLSTKNRYDETVGSANICMNGNYQTCLNAICGNPTITPYKNECLQRFLVSGRDQISSLCLNYINSGNSSKTKDERVDSCEKINPSSQVCNADSLTIPDVGSSVDIVFRRPKLQAEITTRCENNYYSPTNVGIVLKSTTGETRVVVVWKNGQISIDR
ncbi:MAG: hypothetical protein UR85_C0011G0010 [Candidatus Nomurabacteria bacterium GW2011_GWF2_35_66]|nr:MAG: hypothetical protein UR85_C0011G0010 [Candidatus Nomurabacteria bacterium GW2011_GWF2_35_66]HBM45416.1 hypothetical protein [Patescibacteria group bacterium]